MRCGGRVDMFRRSNENASLLLGSFSESRRVRQLTELYRILQLFHFYGMVGQQFTV